MSEAHYVKLVRTYDRARCNAYYAPRMSIREGEADVAVEVDPKFHHAAGAVHGSVYFKLLDDAAFFAANSLVDDVFVLTVSFSVQFMRPVVKGTLTARGHVRHRTGRLFFADSRLFDDQDELVGSGSGVFAKSEIRLTPEIGYR